MNVTEVAQPGKLRQIQAFELRMNIIADATIDLLFTKNRVNIPLSPLLSFRTDFYSIAFALCALFSVYFTFPVINFCLMFYAFENVLPVEVLGLLIKSVKGILKNNIVMFGGKKI